MEKYKQPLVSIVIPCYNHETFVQDCIQSVIDQNYENIELIIIDDGSKDGSVQKIKEMSAVCQKRFTRFEFRYRPNKGLSETLNEALEWCQGEYYSAIASDDIMCRNKTSIQVEFLNKNHKYLAVFGGVILIDEQGEKLKKIHGKNRSYNLKNIIMMEHYLPAPTQMIRTKYIKELGYKSGLYIEDWYMWLSLSMQGNIYCLSNILSFYRQHIDNSSKKINKMQEGRVQVLSFFKKSEHYKGALNNIKWLNAVESYSQIKEGRNKYLIKAFFLNPKKTIYKIIMYFYNSLVK